MADAASSFVVQKHWRATRERVEKFISDTYFTDVNLRGRLYPHTAPLRSLRWYRATGPAPGPSPYQDAVVALEGAEEVLGREVSIGPAWSTHWFRCEMEVPQGPEWTQRQVRLRWDSGCEAMVWKDGEPLQGLTGNSDGHQLRTDFILTRSASEGERFVLYIEVAANGMFGVGKSGLINPPDPNRHFSLSLREIAVFDTEVYNLLTELTIIIDMAKHLPRDSQRAYEALYTANEIVNVCNPFDKSTFPRCHAIAARFLGERNGDSQHVIHAMGHCHIDSAWLWPYSESIRKCGRSWATAVELMEHHPQFTFVCSQAQQLDWVKEHYPGLFQKIKAKAASGQFIPVGGTWVEMDGNIPSGEAFVRQFLIGQRFFKREFGHYCKEFWLPDTFGYSAQLPQIMVGAGVKWFITQKLSWSLTNSFPHHSFVWEGIDGSTCLTHFPPADTYESTASVEDLLKTVRQFKDKGRSRRSVLLFGHGDGGGGPTEDMLERLERVGDVDGLPRVQFSTPERFFSGLETQDSPRLCKWVGELYLELHRGTYTTQARLKQENRAGEFLLHDVDFVTAVSFAMCQDVERTGKVQSRMLPVWKKFLTNQFHDVIPGSCIRQVVEDALEYYSDVTRECNEVLFGELKAMLSKVWVHSDREQLSVLNTFGWNRREVTRLPGEREGEGERETGGGEGGPKRVKKPRSECVQILHDGSEIALVSSPSMGIQPLELTLPQEPVEVTEEGSGEYILENSHLRAKLTADGSIKSLIHKKSSKEAIEPGRAGNVFVLFDDVPLFWDAWDVMEYHLETRRPITGGSEIHVLERGPLRAAIQVQLPISTKSHITLRVILDADCPFLRLETEVEWQESHKFLKVEFPVNVRSHEAWYEIQFGHLSRSTHFNTSWDQARFEVCGHKWADLSEHGFGVALLNDCKYGYSTLGSVMRLSLLRSPKAPDDNADMGTHMFTYAIMPHEGMFQEAGVIKEAYNLNHPLQIIATPFTGSPQSFFSVSSPAIILETVKMVSEVEEDNTSAIVVRLYEAFGSHSSTDLRCGVPVKAFQRCNLLEEPVGPLTEFQDHITLQFKPFEVTSLILHL